MSTTELPWFARAVLVRPRRVARALERWRGSSLVPRVPNEWQITLGVLRMWHRMIYRSETIGTGRDEQRRRTWRARALHHRAVRFPFLLAEKAVAPLDFSGLLSPRERIIRHLLGAHHDRAEFLYDLELLEVHPGALDELLERARAVATGDSDHARWLRDLCVFEDYHARLIQGVQAAVDGELSRTDDPDSSFFGYLAWCARQPETWPETRRALAAGRFTFQDGLSREALS